MKYFLRGDSNELSHMVMRMHYQSQCTFVSSDVYLAGLIKPEKERYFKAAYKRMLCNLTVTVASMIRLD